MRSCACLLIALLALAASVAGALKACELCSAVHAAIYRPWSLDGTPGVEGELPEARAALECEANEVLAAWKDGLRGILSPSEWEDLQGRQRGWLMQTIEDTVAKDPRFSRACTECMKLKCQLCACVEAGIDRARKHRE